MDAGACCTSINSAEQWATQPDDSRQARLKKIHSDSLRREIWRYLVYQICYLVLPSICEHPQVPPPPIQVPFSPQTTPNTIQDHPRPSNHVNTTSVVTVLCTPLHLCAFAPPNAVRVTLHPPPPITHLPSTVCSLQAMQAHPFRHVPNSLLPLLPSSARKRPSPSPKSHPCIHPSSWPTS